MKSKHLQPQPHSGPSVSKSDWNMKRFRLIPRDDQPMKTKQAAHPPDSLHKRHQLKSEFANARVLVFDFFTNGAISASRERDAGRLVLETIIRRLLSCVELVTLFLHWSSYIVYIPDSYGPLCSGNGNFSR